MDLMNVCVLTKTASFEFETFCPDQLLKQRRTAIHSVRDWENILENK